MKALIYLEHSKSLANSGIGRAIYHQQQALASAGIQTTLDPSDTYDLVHINSYMPASYRFLKELKHRGIKVIVHGHSTHEDFKNSFRAWRLMAPFYDGWMDRMYKNADMIITPTEYSKNLIKSYRGVTCPVKAISNGIVLSEYAPSEKAQKAFNDRFSLSPHDRVVVGTGFYFKRKGFDDFIKVAKAMPEVKFVWFGYLKKILTQPYILKCIKEKPSNLILPGYISGDVIKGAYQRADCMLFPTWEETEGIVALEALASHLPLVVRDVPVYADWLTDQVNCLKGHSVEEFVQLIGQAMTQDMSTLTEEGYKVAQERSIEKVGQQLKKAYLEVLETR
jgi:1,2-diacylglycerol-3-alpha-glucose alpha-1,2-glucosyltransferase